MDPENNSVNPNVARGNGINTDGLLIAGLYIISLIAVASISYAVTNYFVNVSNARKSIINSPVIYNNPLPVDLSNKYVIDANIYYTFLGGIKSYDNSSKILVIANSQSLPIFTLNENTQILTVTDKTEPASSSALISGTQVKVLAGYNFKNHTWITLQVSVFPKIQTTQNLGQ